MGRMRNVVLGITSFAMVGTAHGAPRLETTGPVPTGTGRPPAGPTATASPAPPPAPPMRAFVSQTWGGADFNRCVSDVPAAVRNLRSHGDPLGFHLGSFTKDLHFSPKDGGHWQGIQRVAAPGAPRLVITRGGRPMFAIAEMGSRPIDGDRLRSNRIAQTTFYPLTAPPATDRLVFEQANLPGFEHTGGAQISGQILAVPIERGGDSKVKFYALDGTAPPRALGSIERQAISAEAGAVAFGKLADGRFLVGVGRKNSEVIDFYITTTTDPRATAYTLLTSWYKRDVKTSLADGDARWGAYQSINLVAQCDGTLFLVGTHNDSMAGLGDDWVDAYKIENGYRNNIVLTKTAKRHVNCSFDSPKQGDGPQEEKYCNLDAAGGTYVSPQGELVVYGVAHKDTGPGGSMNMMEFRSVFPNPKCGTQIGDAFAELYDDSDFSDRGVILDRVDDGLRNYKDYDKVEGFEDKASAVRYCIPPGHKLRLHEDKNFKGSFIDLLGRGEKRLKDLGFNDKVSSSRWLGE